MHSHAHKRKWDIKRLRPLDVIEAYLTMLVGFFVLALFVAVISYVILYHWP